MTSLILITMDNGRGHCTHWQSCKVPNQTHRGMKKIRKIYAIKQIKICAEYRDMLPRPRLDLSGTPGLRPIGLSPGSWQTSLGLGSMSRYSAQILICIIYIYIYIYAYAYIYIHIYTYILVTPCLLTRIREFYPHAALQYHARPRAKRGIAMLSVDKFPCLRKQTRGNEFIPCSNNICDILKRFRSLKIPAITLIWPKSPYKHSVTRSYRSGKESGRRSESPLWRHQWRSLYISRWWRQTWDTVPYFTVVNQSEARISTEHGINIYTYMIRANTLLIHRSLNAVFVAGKPAFSLEELQLAAQQQCR